MSDTGQNGQLCRATRKDGKQCTAKAIRDGFCFAHDPANGHENRVKGGLASSKQTRALKMLPTRLRPVADLLAQALDETYRGELDPKIATALASLAGALVRVVAIGEHEDRLRELEELVSRPGA